MSQEEIKSIKQEMWIEKKLFEAGASHVKRNDAEN